MKTKRQVKTEDFFSRHPVFSLDEATGVLKPRGGRSGMVERLKHHLETGRLKRVAREIYAVVPLGGNSDTFQPDPYLLAVAARPNGIFCYASALELLGVAHAVCHHHTLFCDSRRVPLELPGMKIQFMEHPRQLRKDNMELLGTQQVERLGQLLRVTGPERTLLEGFRRLDLLGGAEAFMEPVSGFPVLDLDLLQSLLEQYRMSVLWGIAGWFLELYQQDFHVPDTFLERLESQRPRNPHYLLRQRPAGTLVPRWNLVLPPEIARWGESNAD